MKAQRTAASRMTQHLSEQEASLKKLREEAVADNKKPFTGAARAGGSMFNSLYHSSPCLKKVLSEQFLN